MFTNRRQHLLLDQAAPPTANQPARRDDTSVRRVAPRRRRTVAASRAGAVVLRGVFSAALGLVALCHGVSSCGTWPGSRCSAGRAVLFFLMPNYIV